MHIFRTTGTILLLTTLSIILTPSILSAQWSNDPTQNTLVQEWAVIPKIVADSDGGCYITWILNHRPYVSHLDKFGYSTWGGEFVRLGTTTDYPDWGDIDVSSDGALLVTYVDYDTSFMSVIEDLKVRVQKVSIEGVVEWDSDGLVIGDDEWRTFHPRIVSDGEGGAIIAYYKAEGSSIVKYLMLQRIDAEGNFLWGDEGITAPDSQYVREKPEIVSVGNGEFVVQRWVNGYFDFHKFDLLGNFLWEEPVSFVSSGYFAYMVADDSGGVFATERAQINGIRKIRALHIGSDGESLWGDPGVIVRDSITYNYGAPLVKNEDGSITMCWQEDLPVYISTQRITGNGQKLWGEAGTSISSSITDQTQPIITTSLDNSNIFAWTDFLNDEIDYYAQRLDVNGNQMWDVNDILVSQREATQYSHSCCITDSGGMIMTWGEEFENYGVYAQQISSEGLLGYVTSVNPSPSSNRITSTFLLSPAYPNPFNSNTKLSFILNAKSDVIISIYNVLGQNLGTFKQQSLKPGQYSYSLNDLINNSPNLSSGIYFVEFSHNKGQKHQKLILNK